MAGRKLKTEEELAALKELFQHQIDSYDHLIESGLRAVTDGITPINVTDPIGNRKISNILCCDLDSIPFTEGISARRFLYPYECRQLSMPYNGRLMIKVEILCNNVSFKESMSFGDFPVMVKSKMCNLRHANPRELVSRKEEHTEMGGYFISKGIERIVRLIIVQKRNYPMSMVRSAFRGLREGYSDKAISIRCVRDDESAVTNRLYYLNNGSARLGFWISGREYLLPVGLVLKVLKESTDHHLYVASTCSYEEEFQGVRGAIGTQLVGERAQIIIDELHMDESIERKSDRPSLQTQDECLEHIGQYFRPVMRGYENEVSKVVGQAVLDKFIFVHLSSVEDKFNLLIFMIQKLFSLIDHTSAPDNPDALQNQEVLQAGQMIAIVLKAKLEDWLSSLRQELMKMINEGKEIKDFKELLRKNPPRSVSAAIESMLKTGSISKKLSLELPQRSGATVLAERLNFLRFLAHFRAVHRGQSFMSSRVTSVRKLLPETWGFLCPVHTPDGGPCGLLNHLAITCRITSYFDSHGNIKDFFKIRPVIVNALISLGMISSSPNLVLGGPPEVLSVLLDGKLVGYFPSSEVERAVAHLRRIKVRSQVLCDLEVGYVPLSFGGAFPGLFLFTSPSRFIRPVKNISEGGLTELIGPFEQVYMEIKCEDGGDGGRRDNLPATHEELHPTNILSVVASLTPWSNHNQSPRNMYQCQMAKQTMGFSSQSINLRADQKTYHLQTPQNPIVLTSAYTKFCIEESPTGTNAIVAVLAYTGYDMEDAMILNKSSVERGMFHGQIYKTETIDATLLKEGEAKSTSYLRGSNAGGLRSNGIDSDGLPVVGQVLHPGDPMCTFYNEVTNRTRPVKFKGSEPATVDYVSILGKGTDGLQKANIRYRQSRNPIIGDKFSSRHGQKGVCSRLWPDIDMPFSGATGMRPDLIINPHAFPSRMTIAMLLESIAAKGGSLDGKFVDATTFSGLRKSHGGKDSEESSLVDELGAILASHGFNYHGVEVLYSGIYGVELKCEIFIGPVYYQRLRHMVSDKFQVRSTGVVDQVTRQPIKGRKCGGGIRFGEMERDAMLAHGAAYLLHDRLHSSSDYHVADVCTLCGSILTTTIIEPQKPPLWELNRQPLRRASRKVFCLACQTSKGMRTVAMPYVFRYLAAEFAAMNIKMTLELSSGV
ncbi:hypothetical protein Drorol1_Dr00018272 [Drosera rotundifolia]